MATIDRSVGKGDQNRMTKKNLLSRVQAADLESTEGNHGGERRVLRHK